MTKDHRDFIGTIPDFPHKDIPVHKVRTPIGTPAGLQLSADCIVQVSKHPTNDKVAGRTLAP